MPVFHVNALVSFRHPSVVNINNYTLVVTLGFAATMSKIALVIPPPYPAGSLSSTRTNRSQTRPLNIHPRQNLTYEIADIPIRSRSDDIEHSFTDILYLPYQLP